MGSRPSKKKVEPQPETNGKTKSQLNVSQSSRALGPTPRTRSVGVIFPSNRQRRPFGFGDATPEDVLFGMNQSTFSFDFSISLVQF